MAAVVPAAADPKVPATDAKVPGDAPVPGDASVSGDPAGGRPCPSSTIRSQQASSAVVNPAPNLPVPSMAHNVAVAPPEGDQLAVASRIGRNRQALITDAMGSTRRRRRGLSALVRSHPRPRMSCRTYRSGWKIATRSSTSTGNLSRCIGSTLFFTVITRTPTDVLAADVCSSIRQRAYLSITRRLFRLVRRMRPRIASRSPRNLVHVVIKRQSQ